HRTLILPASLVPADGGSIRCVVAFPRVRDLFLCAKHLFVAATRGFPQAIRPFPSKGAGNFPKRESSGREGGYVCSASLGSCFFVGSHETHPRRRIWGTGISQVVTPQWGS